MLSLAFSDISTGIYVLVGLCLTICLLGNTIVGYLGHRWLSNHPLQLNEFRKTTFDWGVIFNSVWILTLVWGLFFSLDALKIDIGISFFEMESLIGPVILLVINLFYFLLTGCTRFTRRGFRYYIIIVMVIPFLALGLAGIVIVLGNSEAILQAYGTGSRVTPLIIIAQYATLMISDSGLWLFLVLIAFTPVVFGTMINVLLKYIFLIIKLILIALVKKLKLI
jgi:hypothetical protein